MDCEWEAIVLIFSNQLNYTYFVILFLNLKKCNFRRILRNLGRGIYNIRFRNNETTFHIPSRFCVVRRFPVGWIDWLISVRAYHFYNDVYLKNGWHPKLFNILWVNKRVIARALHRPTFLCNVESTLRIIKNFDTVEVTLSERKKQTIDHLNIQLNVLYIKKEKETVKRVYICMYISCKRLPSARAEKFDQLVIRFEKNHRIVYPLFPMHAR